MEKPEESNEAEDAIEDDPFSVDDYEEADRLEQEILDENEQAQEQ